MSNALETTEPTIPGSVFAAARKRGDAPAVVEEGGAVVSYAALAERAKRAGTAFVRAGLKPGDAVSIWAPNSTDFIVANLGLQAAGGVLVPLNTRYKGAEAAYILNKSRARFLIAVRSFLGADYVELIGREETPFLERIVTFDETDTDLAWTRFLDGAESHGDALAERLANLGGEDVSDILFTSGTTGHPKGVVTTHGQNVRLYQLYAERCGWTAADRLLAINPFFHSFGYKAGWFTAFLRGASIHPVTRFDPKEALAKIERERISVMSGPPTIFTSLIALDPRPDQVQSLRLAVTGATVVPVSLIHDMQGRLTFESVVTGYGLTETCGTVSVGALDDPPELISSTSGAPMEEMEVRVLDDDGRELGRGELGRIEVRGPNVMRGYFDDPEATAATINPEGWLDTGDIGLLTAEGYVVITDRKKDVFIVGGFNVYPAEVEQMLGRHAGVAEVAVIGRPDERLGEVGHAFIVRTPGAALDEAGLTAWARDNMANFKVPRSVTFMAALPRNASGKVEKYKLRQG